MKKLLVPLIVLTILSACSSDKAPNKSDTVVYMSTIKAPKNCKYIGDIYGPHETFTSGANVHLGKNISQLHINRAKVLGANYVEMNSSLDGGKAYLCPTSELQQLQ